MIGGGLPIWIGAMGAGGEPPETGGGQVIMITKTDPPPEIAKDKKGAQLLIAGALMVGEYSRRDFYKRVIISITEAVR